MSRSDKSQWSHVYGVEPYQLSKIRQILQLSFLMQSTLFTISHHTRRAKSTKDIGITYLLALDPFWLLPHKPPFEVISLEFTLYLVGQVLTLARISFWSFVEACWSGIEGNPPFVPCPPGCMGYWQWRYPDAKEDVHTKFASIVRGFVDHQSTCGAGSIPMFPDTISLYLNDLWKSTRGGFLPWERWITQVSYNPLYFQFKWVLLSSE